MRKIGISSMALFNYSPKEAVERVSELGFGAWEIVLEGPHLLKDYKEVKELSESYDIELFVHAPFSDLNIASLNEVIRKETLAQIFTAIETADFLEAKILTFHSGRPSPLSASFMEKTEEENQKSIEEILMFGSDFNLKLCIENMPNFSGALMCKIPDLQKVLEVNPELGLTLDIAHAHTCGDELAYIKELREKIMHVHLHDNSKDSDSHSTVGEGDIDFKSVIYQLKDFNGAGVIEARNEKSALLSREKFEEIISS